MTDGFPVPGEVFEGRYRISRLIGSGGFARVYSAVQEDLGRDVAIKVLMPAMTVDGTHYSEKLVRRFNQEARLVSRLRDPHTITMFDYGETASGLLYMVFEYIEGRSLSEAVHTDGALGHERVVKVLEATLSSLQEAHAFGVLHRDIKPGNIMLFDYLGRPDQVKLLDFGIAKSLTDNVPGKDITADGALVGTPRYMSPEQIRGQEMGPSSDIYSLGLVAFEMLMGYKVIESSSSVTIIGKQLDSTPFLVPAEADVPDGLKAIVNRMMAKDRTERYVDAEEVLSALRDYKAGKPVDTADVSEDHFDKRQTARLPEINVAPVDHTLSPATGQLEEASLNASSDYAKSGTRRFAARPEFVEPTQVETDSTATRKLAIFAIVALLLIGGGVVAVVTSSGPDRTENEAILEPADPFAMPEPGPGDDDELAVNETTESEPRDDDDSEVSDKESTPQPVELLVATRPVAAAITVKGKSYGQSPAQISLTDADFPLEVVATIDDQTVSQTLTDPTASIILDVDEIVPADKPPAAAKSKPRPKPRDKPTKPKPNEPKEDEPDEKKEFTLPALDL